MKEQICRYIPQWLMTSRRLFIDSINTIPRKSELSRLRKRGGPYNVVFLALDSATWKCDMIYRLMEADNLFNPLILVCPIVNYGEASMIRKIDSTYNFFKQKGYNVLKSIDKSGRYINLRKDLNPDIIFWLNPYKGMIDNRYYIDSFLDKLSVYIPYSFTPTHPNYDNGLSIFHNKVWKVYRENSNIIEEVKKHTHMHCRNVVCSGYPGTDTLIDQDYRPKDNWKIKDHSIKRIIWAPHHTIGVRDGSSPHFSTFLRYYDDMLQFADKYHDKIQIAFKPHPILYDKLCLLWGKDRTNSYYKRWCELDNGMLEDGNYVDLFLTSDAIMHDCCSFISEYLLVNKPALHLDNETEYDKLYNPAIQRTLTNYYKADCKEKIESFIEDLIEGTDPMKEQRTMFIKENMLPPNGKFASQNIIDDLKETMRSNSSNIN